MAEINYGFLPIWVEGTHADEDGSLILDLKIDKVYFRALDSINRIMESWLWELETTPDWHLHYLLEREHERSISEMAPGTEAENTTETQGAEKKCGGSQHNVRVYDQGP